MAVFKYTRVTGKHGSMYCRLNSKDIDHGSRGVYEPRFAWRTVLHKLQIADSLRKSKKNSHSSVMKFVSKSRMTFRQTHYHSNLLPEYVIHSTIQDIFGSLQRTTRCRRFRRDLCQQIIDGLSLC